MFHKFYFYEKFIIRITKLGVIEIHDLINSQYGSHEERKRNLKTALWTGSATYKIQCQINTSAEPQKSKEKGYLHKSKFTCP